MAKEKDRSNDNTDVQSDSRKLKSAGLLIKKGLLLVLSENFFGTSFVIDNVETVIGRAGECDLCIRDRLVSKRHCLISLDGEGNFFIEDLGATNPTYVNKKVLRKRRQLFYGDRIVMGTTILRFFLEEKLGKK